jgi:hypothetical protein
MPKSKLPKNTSRAPAMTRERADRHQQRTGRSDSTTRQPDSRNAADQDGNEGQARALGARGSQRAQSGRTRARPARASTR